MDLVEGVVRLRRDNVGNQRHVGVRQPLRRGGDGNVDGFIAHVGHAVFKALGNNQALNLRFSQSVAHDAIQAQRRGGGAFAAVLKSDGLLEGLHGAVPALLAAQADLGKILRGAGTLLGGDRLGVVGRVREGQGGVVQHLLGIERLGKVHCLKLIGVPVEVHTGADQYQNGGGNGVSFPGFHGHSS